MTTPANQGSGGGGSDPPNSDPWAQVTDDFPGSATGANWVGAYGSVGVTANRLTVSNTAYSGAISARHNLLGSALAMKVEPDQSGGYAAIEVRDETSTTVASISFTGSGSTAEFTSPAGTTTIAYNPSTMLWWRFRHQLGVLHLETSPDGIAWTDRRSDTVTNTDLDSVEIQVSAGPFPTNGTTNAYFSKLNLNPGGPPPPATTAKQMCRTFDANGNVLTVTDENGAVIENVWTTDNLLARTTLKNFDDDPDNTSNPLRDVVLVQNTYDNGDRLTLSVDPLNRNTETSWTNSGKVRARTLVGYQPPAGAARNVELERYGYDPAGNVVQVRRGTNKYIAVNRYDAAGRLYASTVDPTSEPAVDTLAAINNPNGLNRTTSFGRDLNSNVVTKTVTGPDPLAGGTRTERTDYRYDPADRVVCEAIDNGPSADTDDLNTFYTRDARGNVLTATDPRGVTTSCLTGTITTAATYQTTSTYDVAGRLQKVVQPAVALNGSAATVNPTITYGYNALGERTHTRDANTNLTRTSYDPNGRVAQVKHPRYTQPHSGGATLDPAETFVYDPVGNLLSTTNTRGGLTSYAYDLRNRVYKKTDPTVTSASFSVAGVTRTSYDDANNPLSVTDPRGAVASSSYDMLNRVRTTTMTVRATASGNPAQSPMSSFDYDDLDNLTSETSPNGNTTVYGYNPASELVTVADPLNKVTTTVRDLAGRVVRVTDPAGRVSDTVYDLAGRVTQTQDKGVGGTQTPRVSSFTYDKASNPASATTPRGTPGGTAYRTSYQYDALNRTSQITEPVDAVPANDITTRLGYDANGNRTSVRDGRSASATDATYQTTMSYNPWNLPESYVEPSTTAHPNTYQRSWRTSYDPGGLAVRDELPNTTATPLVISSTYDELGRLCWKAGAAVTGSCDSPPANTATTPVNAYRYDLVGNVTQINSPAGDLALEYDDRNLLVASSNPGAYIGTTATSGVNDNPARLEAESAAATGVANAASPPAQPGASNNSYRDWTAGLVNNNNVTFTLNAPVAGRYELRFRYAASAAAVRKLSVGATTIAAGQSFPATGGLDKWAQVSVNAQLAAGNNTVAVTYTTTAPASSGGMLLDAVEFRPVNEAEHGAATAGIANSATPAGASENSSRNWTTNLTDTAFVSVDTRVPQSGRYAISIRYATPAATAAVRNLTTTSGATTLTTLNGVRFPATTASWAAVTVYANLNAGVNTIKLAYATAAPASSGGIHIDKIDVTRPETRAYDQSGRLTQRVDTTGSNTYTWTARDQLNTALDAVTATIRAYDYNDTGQPCLITYNTTSPAASCTRPAGKASRTITYDPYGRIGNDVRHNTTNTETYRADYTYNPDSSLATETIAPAAVAGAGAHSYSYDQTGRLTNWT